MQSEARSMVHMKHQGSRFCCQRVDGAAGSDRSVLFVSGAFQSMKSWARFERHFAGRAEVLAVDLPGTGQSDPLPAEVGLDFLAGAVLRVLDELGIDRVHLVSASYGTAVAYRVGQLFPERIESLVLAGTMRRIPDIQRRTAERTVELLEAGRDEAFATLVMESPLQRDPAVSIENRRVVGRLFRKSLIAMGPAERHKYIENTRRLLSHAPLDLDLPPAVRTLIFTGEHDPFTTPEHCREIASAIPGALFTTIRDADHLFHLERFETTALLIDRFIQGAGLAGIENTGPVEESDRRSKGSPACSGAARPTRQASYG